jgi:hypothetical protein
MRLSHHTHSANRAAWLSGGLLKKSPPNAETHLNQFPSSGSTDPAPDPRRLGIGPQLFAEVDAAGLDIPHAQARTLASIALGEALAEQANGCATTPAAPS